MLSPKLPIPTNYLRPLLLHNPKPAHPTPLPNLIPPFIHIPHQRTPHRKRLFRQQRRPALYPPFNLLHLAPQAPVLPVGEVVGRKYPRRDGADADEFAGAVGLEEGGDVGPHGVQVGGGAGVVEEPVGHGDVVGAGGEEAGRGLGG